MMKPLSLERKGDDIAASCIPLSLEGRGVRERVIVR